MALFGSAYAVPGLYASFLQPQTPDPPPFSSPDIVPSYAPDPLDLKTAPPSWSPPPKPGLFSGWNEPDAQTGLSKWDRVALIGAGLRDDPNVAVNLRNSMMEQGKLALQTQAMRQKQAVLQYALGAMGVGGPQQASASKVFQNGQPVTVPQVQAGQTSAAPSILPQAGMQPGMTPAAAQGGLPVLPGAKASPLDGNMRKALAVMALANGEPQQAATILDDKRHIVAGPGGVMFDQDSGEIIGRIPSWKYTSSGDRYDEGDPNAPKFLGEAPGKGMDRVFDSRGNPIGWRNADGTLQALAQQTAATTGAEEAARAPYQIKELTGAGPGGSTVYGTVAGLTGPGGMLHGSGVAGMSPGDLDYNASIAKDAAAQYQAMQTAGNQAQTNIAKYQRLGELLDGYSGNKLSGAGVELAQFARGIPGMGNFDPKLPNKEAAMAIANQLALSLRDPSQGGGMPGSLSNSDRDFLMKSVPNLAQTDQGRKLMVDAAVKLNQRNADLAAKARQWQQRFGRIDRPDSTGKTFADYVQAYAEANPLFGGR